MKMWLFSKQSQIHNLSLKIQIGSDYVQLAPHCKQTNQIDMSWKFIEANLKSGC